MPDTPSPRTGHFVLIGHDGLTYRLANHLTSRYGADVVVLMTEAQHHTARDFSELPRVEVTTLERLDEKALVNADLPDAAGLAVAVQDDVANIHIALQARDLAPDLRLVVRMYNTRLGTSIEKLLGNCKVLSDAEIAAPALIASTLDEVAANPVEVGKRTLIVAKREDVTPAEVVCGLADTTALGEPQLLPADTARANLVLAELRKGRAEDLLTTVTVVRQKRRWWRFAATRAFIWALFSRKIGFAFLLMLLTLLTAGAVLALNDPDIGAWDSFYLVVVNAFGGLEPQPEYTRAEQALQLVIGIAGLALIPLITALIVEGVVNAKLAFAQGRLLKPVDHHIVLVGLGGVGTRILRLLHDRGLNVVAIDQNENARGMPLARELHVPTIIGDASRETTLRQAGVERCQALMTVASTDALNLEVALQARNLKPRLRVLVRIFDGDLASRVRKAFDLRLTRSVSYVAAPAFAEALMDREVVGTISVERRVLLLAEVIVGRGSALDGAELGTADSPGETRVIAVTPLGEPRPLWNPPHARKLAAVDKLTVVCTRDGLSRLIRRSRGADLIDAESVS